MKIPKLSPYLTPMNHRMDSRVDKFINDMLDRNPGIHKVTDHTVTFRVRNTYISVWIGNRWYAYGSTGYDTTTVKGEFSVLGRTLWDDKRPRRRTMLRLDRYIEDNKKSSDTDLSLSSLIGEDFNNARLNTSK